MKTRVTRNNSTYYVRLPFEYVKQHRINETMAVDIFIGENGSITVKPVKSHNGVENGSL